MCLGLIQREKFNNISGSKKVLAMSQLIQSHFYYLTSGMNDYIAAQAFFISMRCNTRQLSHSLIWSLAALLITDGARLDYKVLIKGPDFDRWSSRHNEYEEMRTSLEVVMCMSTKGSVIKPRFVCLVIRSRLWKHRSSAEKITANRIKMTPILSRHKSCQHVI